MSEKVANCSFILGLDGIPWDLLSNWATAGELPNFQRLMQEGASGPLESTMPPTTATAWPSIFTGTRPDQHGIYSFRRLTSSYTHEMNTSNDIKQPTLWDILSPAVVANVPMTYPAQEIDGKMVTGMMTPSKGEEFTHPPELREEIADRIPEYEIGLSWHQYHDREEEFIADLSELLASRRQLMRYLMETEDWELFFFVYTEPDRLQHLIWDEEVILEHYRELDDILGEVMEYVEERNANLFVVSDHGFEPIQNFLHVNTLLEEGGFLNSKESSHRKILSKVGINKENIVSLLTSLGIFFPLLRLFPSDSVHTVADAIPGQHSLYDIDYAETEVFGYAKRNIYLNDSIRFSKGPLSPNEKAELKEDVETFLSSNAVSEKGDPLLTVHDGDRLFPTDPDSPDLVVKGINGTEENTNLSESVIKTGIDKAGAHHREGIFLAWGPNIKSGFSLTRADVFDVAPTILHGCNNPIPQVVPGQVLEIFRAESPPAKNTPTFKKFTVESPKDEDQGDFSEVEERLEGLGYM